jgi:RND superfamily putative drug exporter
MTRLGHPMRPMAPRSDLTAPIAPEPVHKLSLFEQIGLSVTRRPRQILAVTGLVVVFAAVAGLHASSKLSPAGLLSPSAPSQVAANLLDAHFGGGSPNLVFVVEARRGTVEDPAVASAGRALDARLAAQPGVSSVTSWWVSHDPALKSRDSTAALVEAHVDGSDATVTTRAEALVTELSVSSTAPGPVTVVAGGSAATNAAISDQLSQDLKLAETIAIPLTLLLLIIVFGSLVAAFLPVLVGVLAIVVTLAVLWILSSVTTVSVYAINLTTALGLGLAVDYSLLMVSRYREQLATSADPRAAVRRAVKTAGRTIAFSAATVAAAMAVLLVFPVSFLRSFAYAGISVVIVATLAAVIVLPAMLSLLGPRVDALRVPWRRAAASGSESPFWRSVASIVLRRPLTAAVPVVALLLLLGAPFLGVHFGTATDRVLPESNPARQAGIALQSKFNIDSANTLDAVATPALTLTAGAVYSRELSSLAGVSRVVGPAGIWSDGRQLSRPTATLTRRYQVADASRFSAAITPDPDSAAAQTLVSEARSLGSPNGTSVAVGGAAAQLVDELHDLSSELPLAVGLIALTTFVLLFLFTGSVVLPIKALALNGLGLSAAFGVIVWIFQQGHLTGLLGFTPTPLAADMLVLLFCVAFGLSMDYEVFLLSRIKEHHDSGVSSNQAVTDGLARTGRIVTTAAALLCITFFALASSRVSFIQMFGLGTGVAILLDATLVRGVLVPALMRLAGEWIWWAPGPLRRVRQRGLLTESSATV